MSMTLVNAKIYVARIIGGGAESQESLDMAGEAILRAYQDWQTKKFWRFLLKDTTVNSSIAVTGLANGATITVASVASAGDFDSVNVGQTVTYAGVAGTLAADTTVLSFTRGTGGTVATVVLSAAVSGIPTTEAGTFTFTGPIPIIAGTNEYNLPADFNAPFSARLTTTPRSLVWRDQRWWDRTITDQTVRGTPADYTTYNPYSDLTQNYGTMRLKFDRIPNASDVLLLRYYRKFTTDGTNIDMIDDYLYQFLDYARNLLLATKRAQDDPAQFAKNVGMGIANADEDDEEPTDDNDVEQCMKSQYEVGPGPRQLWGNGDFSPFNY